MLAIKKLKSLLTGHYTLLLILLVGLFIFRPYHHNSLYYGIWKIFLTATLIAAIFNCEHKKKVKRIVSILAIPSLILTWVDLFYEDKVIVILFAFFTIWFMFVCVTSILYDVLKGRVNAETLRGVVSAYFLVAFMFSYIYFFIEYVVPGSFTITGKIVPIFPHPYYLAEMLYFSFVTLLTIGYGDIVAVQDVGQTAAVMEGIIGQFYIAILVSRLVAIYTFSSDKRLLKDFEKELDHKKTIS